METTMNLPENEKEFEISVTGDTSKQLFTGKFRTVCVPNLRQRAQASVMAKQLNGDIKTLDEDTMLYHRLISQLSARLLAAPQWWVVANGGQDLLDINVVFEVWKRCLEAETEWRTQVWGKPEEPKTTITDSDAGKE
jgi:hypothetical protein